MTQLAYGFWRYGAADRDIAIRMLEAAREAGIRHFDTADCYGGREDFGAAERLLGDIRKEAPSLFEGAELATKAGVEFGTPYNSSRAYIVSAVEASLKRLNVERIDLFYIHRFDMTTHPQELAGTLDGLVASGKAASIGVSNYTASQLAALRQYLKAPLVAHQVEFSLLHTAPIIDGVLDQAMAEGIKVYAWSPLAGGALMSPSLARAETIAVHLQKKAAEFGCAPSTLALAFLLAHPAGVTPIIGTKTPARLNEAVEALSLTLDRAAWYELLQTSMGTRLP